MLRVGPGKHWQIQPGRRHQHVGTVLRRELEKVADPGGHDLARPAIVTTAKRDEEVVVGLGPMQKGDLTGSPAGGHRHVSRGPEAVEKVIDVAYISDINVINRYG